MKFLEPLRKIHEESILKKDKPKLIRGLSVLALACAFCLYVSDNMVWFSNMGIIPPRSRFSGLGGLNYSTSFSTHYEWRRLRDITALWKNCIGILKYLFDALRNFKR